MLNRSNPNLKPIHKRDSKLDLIDDTTLTSLPFPPPPPAKRHSLRNAQSLNMQRSFCLVKPNDSKSFVKSPLLLGKSSTLSWAENTKRNNHYSTDSISQNTNEEMQQEAREEDDEGYSFFDYSYDEADPIVFVEDYLSSLNANTGTTNSAATSTISASSKNSNKCCSTSTSIATLNLRQIHRQISLADFKSRKISNSTLQSQSQSRSQSQGLLYIHHNQSQGCTSSIYRNNFNNVPESFEDLEAIFGEIPGSELLKSCNLCDKPLYELSSIIQNAENMHLIELICGDCVYAYEEYLGEQAKQGYHKTDESEKLRERLLKVFLPLCARYNAQSWQCFQFNLITT